MTELGPPGRDTVEVTVIGPGRGESVVVHVGGGDWIVVDSCVHRDGEPAALRHLAGIDVRPSQVAYVIASHWHDDHIRGFSELAVQCANAAIACSDALEHDEFLGLVETDEHVLLSSHSGVRELKRTFQAVVNSDRTLEWLVADRLLFRERRSVARPACEIWALSPSSASISESRLRFKALLPERGQPIRAVPRPLRNPSSVVLLIRIGDTDLLLGADLERSGDANQGWTAVVRSVARPSTPAHFVKVPHHGSSDAHDDQMWSQLLVPEPQAAVTPFNSGRVKLPRASDISRIAALTPNAWLTKARADRRTRPRPRAVERTIKEAARSMRTISVDPGKVTFRCEAGDPARWQVTTSPSAVRLTA
jgi:Metallo-beta-lactamase superfamily